MNPDWISALWGGVLIGIAVSMMLLWNGRVTGISGILYGLVDQTRGNRAWRLYFLVGLIMGGLTLQTVRPEIFENAVAGLDWTTPVAGLLVGFGTVLGSGCTSGHGVCGMSRLSIRSLVATLTFIAAGVASVFAFRTMGILP